MQVLVVEDDQEMANIIKQGLEERSHTVQHAADGRRGLDMALMNLHDVIVLDVKLPELSGLTVLQQLRSKNINVPVLLLTVRSSPEDETVGLDAGADDYLAKPFSFEVFVRRVEKLLKHPKDPTPASILKIGDLKLDPLRHEVSRGDEKIGLTLLEFNLLKFLMENRCTVVTYESIVANVWQNARTSNNAIQACMTTLRKKIRNPSSDSKLIHTKGSVGYIMEER